MKKGASGAFFHARSIGVSGAMNGAENTRAARAGS